MGDARVARDRFHQGSQALGLAAQKQRLHAAMLVAELDLEMMHGLAEAHEAKGSRLDDPGVDRAHRDFVNLLAREIIERVFLHLPEVLSFEAHRLEPRVVGDPDSQLLVDLALEALRRREIAGERVPALLDRRRRPEKMESPSPRLENGGEDHRIGVRLAAEERDKPLPLH